MNIITELYQESIERLPKKGQHILANQANDNMIVYQAYNPRIAHFAVNNQYLGGTDFSLSRMSWIKPNFLWMMYRCGWAAKENQEHVLAITIKKRTFEGILEQAVFSSYDPKYYKDHDQWRQELLVKEVRLQWDPDHDPFGAKLERRAIQIGLKGEALTDFIKNIILIEDITDFVKQQKLLLDNGKVDELLMPVETIFKPNDEALSRKIGIE